MTRPTPGPDDRFDGWGCAGGLLIVVAALVITVAIGAGLLVLAEWIN